MKLAAYVSLAFALVVRCRSGSNSLAFVALGDWGGKGTNPFTTHAELLVGKAMAETATSLQSNFTVALGDNFYYYGVKDVSDSRFKNTFEVCCMTACLRVDSATV